MYVNVFVSKYFKTQTQPPEKIKIKLELRHETVDSSAQAKDTHQPLESTVWRFEAFGLQIGQDMSRYVRPFQTLQGSFRDGIRVDLCTEHHRAIELFEGPTIKQFSHVDMVGYEVDGQKRICMSQLAIVGLFTWSLFVFFWPRLSTRSCWQPNHITSKKSMAKTT